MPCFLWLVLPGPGSGGFRPTTPRGLIPGPLTMSCWPPAAPGCAQDGGYVMLAAVCKWIKPAVAIFAMQNGKWLVELVTSNACSPPLSSQGVTGALVDLTAFHSFLCPRFLKTTSTGTCILTCGRKCTVQREEIWMVNPSSLERPSFLKGSDGLPLLYPATRAPSLAQRHFQICSLGLLF